MGEHPTYPPVESPAPRHRPRWGWHTLWMTLLLLAGVVFAATNTPFGRDQVRQTVEQQVGGLFQGATLSIGRLDGNLLRFPRLEDVLLQDATGDTLLYVERARVRYRLWPLLDSKAWLDEVHLEGTRARAVQGPAGSWDWASLMASSDDEPGTWSVRVDSATIADTRLRAVFAPSEADSILDVTSLDMRLARLELPADGDVLLRRIDITSRFHPPGRTDTADLLLGLGLERNRILLDTLSLQSARSHLTGSGQVDLTALPSLSFDAPDSVRAAGDGNGLLTITAQPFTLADVSSFLPILQPDGRLSGRIQLEQNVEGSSLRADLDAAHGGRVSASARWADTEGAAAAVLDFEAATLDLDRILRAGIVTSPITGSGSVSLEGPRSDSLSGRVRLDMGAFAVDDIPFGKTRLEVSFDRGRGDGNLTSRVRDASVSIDVSGRWFDAEPTASWAARLDGLDVASWLGDETFASRLAARFEGQLSGFDPSSMTADARLTVLPSSFAQVDTLEAGMTATMRSGFLRWDLDSRMDAGGMSARGRLDVEDLMLDSLRVQTRDLDLAALLGVDSTQATVSSISAVLEGAADLESWESGSGTVSVRLDSTRWNAFHLADFEADLSWQTGRATLNALASPSDTSRIDLGLSVRAQNERIRVESTRLTWANVDISDLSTVDILQAGLSGSGSLQAVIGPEDISELDVFLEGTPSHWGEQEVESLRLSVRATRDRLDLTADGQFRHRPLPEWSGSIEPGSWHLDVRADNWQRPDIRAEAGMRLEGLDPLAFAGLADPGTELTGQMVASLTFREALPHTGSFRLDLEPSLLRFEALSAAEVEGSLADSVATVRADVSIAEGRLESTLTSRPFDEMPSFSGTGEVVNVALLPLLGRPDLASDVNLTWTIQGASFDPTVADWRIDIDGSESHLDALLIEDLSTHLTWDGMVLDIRELSAQFNKGKLQINGPVNLDPDRSSTYSDLRATWYIGDLSVIQGLLRLDRLASGEGTVDLQVFGSPGELEMEFLVSLAELEVNTQHLSSIEASGWTRLDEDFLPVETTARMDLGYVALPTVGIRTSSLQVDQRADIFEFSGGLVIDTGNRLELAGLINPFATRPWANVQKLDVTLGGEHFDLDRSAGVVFNRGWQVDRLALRSGDQMVGVTGGYTDSTGFLLRLQADQFLIDPVGDLAGFPELEGRLSGSMSLTGNMEYPLIDSDWDVMLMDAGEQRAHITADLKSTPDGLRIDSIVEVPGSSPITVAGFLPVFPSLSDKLEERADRTADLNLDITTEGGSVAWLESFFDPTVLTDVQGRATADIKVGGTIEDPALSGFLDLDDARFRLPELGVTYRLNRFRSTLEGVTIQVNEARVRSGDGSMDLTGSIDFASLTNSSFDLQAQLKDFRAVRNEELHANVSGDLHLGGRTTRPELSGRLTTFNTSFWLTDTAGGDLDQVDLTFDDQVMLAENFGYRPVVADTLADAMWKGLSMDLALVMDRDTWIRQRVNPEMAIELTGRMDVQKDRGSEDVNLYRSIEVNPDRSYIKQFGRNFSIKEGLASFNGPIEEMVLQVTAEYEVPSRLNPGQPEVVITLTLGGRLDDLEFNLSSDPAMENTDIVSYIATGRPASESLQFSDSSLNNQVIVGVAASQLAGLVEGVASQSLGLDVVDIQQDGLKGTRLTAGKYVTPRLFVGVTQPFTFGSGSNVVIDQERELTLEYKIFEYLLLQLLADASDSPVRVNLAGRYAY